MAEQLDSFVKTFDFIEENRADIALVGNIRLNPHLGAGVVTLKADANGHYPTTGDNYVIGPLFKPAAVRQWLTIQAFVDQTKLTPTSQPTGDLYRVHDGTNQWWWTGSAWAQTTTDWNIEADIANNLASFLATTRQIRIVVKLTTTDKRYTPVLRQVKLGWTGRVFYFDDIVYRSLVPLLKTVRVPIDAAVPVPFPGGTTFDVGKLVKALDVPFNVKDVEAIFNTAQDPDCYNNLLSSYNPTTEIATLASAIPVGAMVRVRMLVQPEVAVETTSQDYSEMEKIPAITIADFEERESSPLSGDDGVTNKSTNVAIKVPAPYRFDIHFTMILLAPSAVDLMRMVNETVKLMAQTTIIRSKAMDEPYRLWLVDEFATRTAPNLADVSSSQATFRIMNMLAFTNPATQEKGVGQVQVGGSFNFNVP